MEGQPHLRPGPLSGVVHRNIRALVEEHHKLEQRKDRQQRIADAITRFTGSMTFVYLHLGLFGGWLRVNSGLVPITRLIHRVDGIAARLGVESGRDAQLEELKHDVVPEKVLEELEKVNHEDSGPPGDSDSAAPH